MSQTDSNTIHNLNTHNMCAARNYITDEVLSNNRDDRDDIDDRDDSDDDSDRPPPPAAAAMLIAADCVERNTAEENTAVTYIPKHAIYNILSWLGSSLYTIITSPSMLTTSAATVYSHEQILGTILKLNNHLHFLDKKIDNMNENTARFAEKAKLLYKKKNVNSAMHQIRLKKMYDREIQKLESLKFNIESQILHMDSVEIMMVTVDTIKDTGEYYKNMHSTINISQLENTLDEMVEHRDAATDIQSILNDINTFSENTYDDDDLLKELQEMSVDEAQEPAPLAPTIQTTPVVSNLTMSLADLPRAPTHALTADKKGLSQSVANLDNISVSF